MKEGKVGGQLRPDQGGQFTADSPLKGGCVENVVSARDGAAARFKTADVSNEEFDFVSDIRILCLVLMAHIILLLLVAGENPDLTDIRPQESLQYGIPKTTGTTGNHQGFIFKN